MSGDQVQQGGFSVLPLLREPQKESENRNQHQQHRKERQPDVIGDRRRHQPAVVARPTIIGAQQVTPFSQEAMFEPGDPLHKETSWQDSFRVGSNGTARRIQHHFATILADTFASGVIDVPAASYSTQTVIAA